MKRAAKMTSILIIGYTAMTLLIGCGPKNKNPISQPAATPATSTNSCTPAGNGSLSYVCVDSTVVSDPFQNSPKVYTAELTPSNATFESFLKEAMGVCDRQSGQLLGFDFGKYDCNAYLKGITYFSIYVSSSSSPTATISIASYYRQTNMINVNLSAGLTLAPWAYQNPMSLPSLSVAPIKNNAGFEIYGPATNPAFQAYSLAWAKQFRVRVENGKLTDSIVTGDIYYGNNLMASGVTFQLQNIGY